MPFIPAIETARVVVEYLSNDGSNAANVCYVADTLGSPSLARLEQMCDIMEGWLASFWDAQASNDWTATRVTATNAEFDPGAQFVKPVTVPGVSTEVALPGQDTIAITLQTGLTGRSQRGRWYHVGLHEAQVTQGKIDSATRTALLAAYQALIDTWPIDDFQLVVASFQTNGAPRATAQLTPVTGVNIYDLNIDRQIRRMPQR